MELCVAESVVRKVWRESTQSESWAWLLGEWDSAAAVSRSVRARSWSKRMTGARDNERCGVKNDVVRHTVRVRVRDKTAVRSIVAESRPEIEADESKVIPSRRVLWRTIRVPQGAMG